MTTLIAQMEAAAGRAAERIRAAVSGAGGPGGDVAEAMAYAAEGGKGLRAFLVEESAKIFGATDASGPAAAIEAMHAYSLAHDDLPCMDDDDLRRGRPTLHKRWDEATAVLAGDGLQSLAFALAADVRATAEARLGLVTSLAEAAGIHGMVGGQAMDIAAETAPEPLTLPQIERLQAGKTGALLSWAAMAGARIAGEDPAPFAAYGAALGLGFQIADDLLDVEGDAATLGKATGKDAHAGKATFVSLLGVEGARARAAELAEAAEAAISPYGVKALPLRDAARFAISRDR
ncbi:polyprenyl synthetase family protein [Pseudoroseicyclus sp. CXY001]|uniref:polyprenyl synthetase family protein n=1 Tax=Pseudoroseicyclus sp. CXY001 TaxID=3242492 RepID=UPI0035714923